MANPTLKILLADDDPDILEVMAKRLAAVDFDVVTASDGIEALAKARGERPDILVLDVNMPGKDGFEVLKDFRETPPDNKWRPVIIVSAQNELDSFRKGFSLEADHYLSKPCRMEDLLNAIYLMMTLMPLRSQE